MLPSRRLRCPGRRDRGSAAAELVLITPVLVLLMLLVTAAGRLVQARLETDSAARQAARAASLAHDPATAAASAASTAQTALASENITCGHLAVTSATSDFRPGGQVTVQVSCTVTLSDLSLLRLPGSETLSSSFTSPIDVFRATAFRFSDPGLSPVLSPAHTGAACGPGGTRACGVMGERR